MTKTAGSTFRRSCRLGAHILFGTFITAAGMSCSSVEVKEERVASAGGGAPALPPWVEGKSSKKVPDSNEQILFTTKLIGISRPGGGAPPTSSQKTLDDQEYQRLITRYSQMKGADLLSAPSVVTRSGQPAKAEIIQELVYPTGPEPGAATKTANLGVTVHYLGIASRNKKTIKVKTLVEVVELAGFEKVEGDFELPQLSTVQIGGEVTINDGQTIVFTGSGGQSKRTKVTRLFGIRVKRESEPLEMELIFAVTAKLAESSGVIE